MFSVDLLVAVVPMHPHSLRRTAGRALVAIFASAIVFSAHAQTVTALTLTSGQTDLVSYGGSTSSFATFIGGVELNSFVGATTFYGAGYTGTRSTIANISGGLAYTGHEATSKIGQVFSGTGALTGTAAVTAHETECSSMAAGYYAGNPYSSASNATSYSSGIAYGANLWSGNVATSISANGSFGITTNSVFSTYYNALIGGVGGSTANIVTSSWGSTSTDAATQRSLSAGADLTSLSIDAVVAASHKLVVFAAGNNGAAGSTANILYSPGSPAGGNNALVVGAAGPNNYTANASYGSRASFSAYGPSAALIATTSSGGTIVNESVAQRARVDILAPGQGIVGAYTQAGTYSAGDGTSFATPIVAGGAGLIEDAGQALGFTNATDNRVVTAILQNSATQLAGWTNNAATGADGVYRTTQALDFQQGAGEMNLTKAYDQLTGGTHDVAGTGGGAVLAKGWDYGELNVGRSNDYTMSLLGGSSFESTLRFDSGAGFGTVNSDGSLTSSSNLAYQYMSDFSIQLLLGSGPTATLLAESSALYTTSELFNYAIGTTGLYTLRVNYLGDIYNLSGHGAVGYGLAWYGVQAAPEPASLAALGLGALAMLRRRKRA